MSFKEDGRLAHFCPGFSEHLEPEVGMITLPGCFRGRPSLLLSRDSMRKHVVQMRGYGEILYKKGTCFFLDCELNNEATHRLLRKFINRKTTKRGSQRCPFENEGVPAVVGKRECRFYEQIMVEWSFDIHKSTGPCGLIPASTEEGLFLRFH